MGNKPHILQEQNGLLEENNSLLSSSSTSSKTLLEQYNDALRQYNWRHQIQEVNIEYMRLLMKENQEFKFHYEKTFVENSNLERKLHLLENQLICIEEKLKQMEEVNRQ